MYVISDISTTSGAQPQLASLIWSEDPRQVGELWEQEVGGAGEHRHHQDRLLVDPLEVGEVDLGDVGLGLHLVLQVGEQALALAQRGARRPAERLQLEAGQRAGDDVASEHLDRDGDGARRAGDDGEGGEHLGDLGVEQRVVDGELGEAEVDEPRRPLAVDEHVGAAQVAMGDAVTAQQGDLFEHRGHHGVGHGLVRQGVDRGTVDAVVRQQHRVDPDAHDTAHARRVHADVARDQRDERLVLDRALQRGERAIVADVLEPQEPVHPVHQVGRPLGLAEHLHEHALPVLEGREVRGRGPGVDARRLQVAHRQPGVAERLRDRRHRRAPVGTAEGQQHAGADRGAQRDRDHHVARQVVADDEAHQHEGRQGDRPRPPPARRHERTEHHERRGELGEPDLAAGRGVGQAGPLGDLVDEQRRVLAVEQLEDDPHQAAGHGVGDGDVAEQPEPPRHEGPDQDGAGDAQPEPLEGSVQHPLDARRDEVEHPHDVLLEPQHRVLDPEREGDDQERDRGVHEQSQEVTGRSLVAEDLLGGIVGALTGRAGAGRARLGGGHRLPRHRHGGNVLRATVETYSTVVAGPPKARSTD